VNSSTSRIRFAGRWASASPRRVHNLYEEISRNKRRTAVVILIALLFAGGLGYLFSYLILRNGVVGLAIALVVMGALSWSSYRYGHRLVLRVSRARLVTKEDHARLINVVEGLAIAAGLPTPSVYVIPEAAPNAFATGPNPKDSHVAVTQGLLDSVNRVELEGVIAHEMAHIQDRDILLGTVVATLVGSVVLLSDFMLRWLWWGGGVSRGRRGSGDRGGGFAVLMIAGVVLAILAPLFAAMIRAAVSRRREYLADAQGAMLTRYPPGLAAALRKIAADHTPMRVSNNATAHLWLSQPSRVKGEGYHWYETLFATHPPIEDRIRILDEM
jgi:heat shock protein HtpX